MHQQMYCLNCGQKLFIHDIVGENIKGMGSYFEENVAIAMHLLKKFQVAHF